MIESALSALLASVAGHYAELSPSDVGIGLNGGRLAVEDVQLRPENLNFPALPFRIISGRAGILRVNVPWSMLSSAPVSVYLENVELVAAPRSADVEKHANPAPKLPSALRWHETRIGRVLFNLQAEVVGLRVEYRDGACVANVEAEAVRAHSVDANWERAFVPLDGCGIAVAMRKLLAIEGLRCVMVPAPADGDTAENSCFESRTPLLDGVDVAVKALLCAGEGERNGEKPDGVHFEIDVELDQPAVNLSRRQTRWIQRIFEHGLSKAVDSPADRPTHPPRSQSADFGKRDNGQTLDPCPPRSAPPPHSRGSPLTPDDDDNNDVYSNETSSLSDLDTTLLGPEKPSARGGFSSLWHAIVAENGDETVDDAAYALGLQSAEMEHRALAMSRARRRSRSLTRRRISRGDADSEVSEEAIEERFAREAVAAAAEAGGLTIRCRLRTPDPHAWAQIKVLEHELREERMVREGLQDAEAALMAASERVRRAEEAASAAKIRNAALLRELADLEEMTSNASRNKDAMIRQIEGALQEAQRNLQVLLEERANAWGVGAGGDNHVGSETGRKSERRLRHASSDTFVVVGGSSEDDIGGSIRSESELSDLGNENVGNEYSGLSHGLPPIPPQGDTAGEIEMRNIREETESKIAADEALLIEKRQIIEQQLSPPLSSLPRTSALEESFSKEGLTFI